MSEAAFIRLRRMWLIVLPFVAVVGLLSLGASSAQATCGDYLGHHGSMSSDAANMPNGSHPAGNIPHRKPCHGPSCQQAPINVPAPVPVVSFESQDRWMLAVTMGRVTLDPTSFLAHLSEPVVLPMVAFRLDRPPKV